MVAAAGVMPEVVTLQYPTEMVFALVTAAWTIRPFEAAGNAAGLFALATMEVVAPVTVVVTVSPQLLAASSVVEPDTEPISGSWLVSAILLLLEIVWPPPTFIPLFALTTPDALTPA